VTSAPRPSASLSAAPAEDALIELRGLHKSFGTQHVLRGVDLTVRRGETLVILGASGGGKSVILKHCIGLLKPDAGEVRVDGTVISSPTTTDLATIHRRMGMLFQGAALFDSMTVGENVIFAVREHDRTLTSAQLREIMERNLALVNLKPDVAAKMPSELSGGMKKRLGLARALALQPEILLYDEPTTGLDPVTSGVINDLILDMQRKLGMTSVVVTHDLASAFRIADRMAFLYEGRIIFHGPPDALRACDDPRVREFVGP
jgi:phospholipid/cholesterol/gamma-HCH transport system ATP-binding protein